MTRSLPLPFPFHSNLAIFDDMLLLWIIGLGSFAFVLMSYDKLAAKVTTKRRMRERNFWLVAALGGFVGIVFGALVFHRKVAKLSFWIPMIATVLIWLALFNFLKIMLN